MAAVSVWLEAEQLAIDAKPIEAADKYEEAAKLLPRREDWRLASALAYAAGHNIQAAKSQLAVLSESRDPVILSVVESVRPALERGYIDEFTVYKSAAESGDPSSMDTVARLYLTGRGVPRDSSKAISWYRKGVSAESSKAMTSLGLLYYSGRGVAKDLTKAYELFQRAAEAGNPRAMSNLATMLYRGESVPADHSKAIQWYQKAARFGESSSQAELKRLDVKW